MILYKLANKILSFKKRIGFIANNDEPIPGPQPAPEPVYPIPPAPEPEPEPDTVKIGSHYYKVKQIGNLLWTIENIYEPVSYTYTDRNPAYRWINNDSTNPDGYGMAYAPTLSQLKAEFATLAPEGWRIPTITDWNSTFNGYSSRDLIDTTEAMKTGYGDNTLGFCAKCAGGFSDRSGSTDYPFGYKQESLYISDDPNGNVNSFFIYSPNASDGRATTPQGYYMTFDRHAYPLRMCRDI